MTKNALLKMALTAAVALTATPLLASPAQALPPKHIEGNQTVKAYDYTNAIREVVWVESTVDSDSNPGLDRIAVDIVRPLDRDTPDLKVHAIIEASPYYDIGGRGNEGETKILSNPDDPTSHVNKMPLYYDNYFVPRGYAFLGVDLSGSNRSTGCLDVGGKAEIQGAKAVMNWLNGTAKAFNSTGNQVFATWFAGKAGMIGKSWDGGTAVGVASTGVPGLATVVPISAVTSWYDWERLNAGVVAKVSSMLSLHDTYNPAGACNAVRTSLANNSSINYNAFWAERDFIPSAANVKASVFLVHGMNDLNVKSSHFGRWWDQLAANNIPRKLWLSQEQHVDPFDFRRAEWVDTLHRWFDFWLYGLDNGIMNEPQATVERGPDVWEDMPVWPPAGTTAPVYYMRPGNELSTAGAVPGTIAFNDVANSESTVSTSPLVVKPGRATFLTAPLAQNLHLAGSATVTVRMQSSKPTATLTARLVDYGPTTRVNWDLEGGIDTLDNTVTCEWGESSPDDDACYKETVKHVINTDTTVLSRGWIDLAHRNSLSTPANMPAGSWETVTFRLAATDQIIPAGHRVGLVISSTDSSSTWTTATGSTLTFDLGRCILRLPTAP